MVNQVSPNNGNNYPIENNSQTNTNKAEESTADKIQVFNFDTDGDGTVDEQEYKSGIIQLVGDWVKERCNKYKINFNELIDKHTAGFKADNYIPFVRISALEAVNNIEEEVINIGNESLQKAKEENSNQMRTLLQRASTKIDLDRLTFNTESLQTTRKTLLRVLNSNYEDDINNEAQKLIDRIDSILTD